MAEVDAIEQIIEKIADAVVRKLDEREKIDLIAEAVLERLNGKQTRPTISKLQIRKGKSLKKGVKANGSKSRKKA